MGPLEDATRFVEVVAGVEPHHNPQPEVEKWSRCRSYGGQPSAGRRFARRPSRSLPPVKSKNPQPSKLKLVYSVITV